MRFLFIIFFFVFIIQMLRMCAPSDTMDDRRPTDERRVVMCANCACGGNLIVLWFCACAAPRCVTVWTRLEFISHFDTTTSTGYSMGNMAWCATCRYFVASFECNRPYHLYFVYLHQFFYPIITAVRQRRYTSMETCECEWVMRKKKYCGKTHSHQCGHSFALNAE